MDQQTHLRSVSESFKPHNLRLAATKVMAEELIEKSNFDKLGARIQSHNHREQQVKKMKKAKNEELEKKFEKIHEN